MQRDIVTDPEGDPNDFGDNDEHEYAQTSDGNKDFDLIQQNGPDTYNAFMFLVLLYSPQLALCIWVTKKAIMHSVHIEVQPGAALFSSFRLMI